MKKMIRKDVKIVVTYKCPICYTKYKKESDAKECFARKLEEKKFEIGDMVRAKEQRQCWKGKNYVCEGTIVDIIGPKPSDYEYEVKWLGGDAERLNSHVWMYEIEYKCPICEKTERVRYHTPEIEKIEPSELPRID